MRKLLISVLLVFATYMMADAQLVWEERFAYESGTALEGQGGWELGTGKWTSGDSPIVSDRKIRYGGYASSESGSVAIGGTGINRITYRTIDEKGIRRGTVYVAMLINLESVDGTRDFITLDSGTGDSPKAKVFVRKNGSGFSVGASMSDAKHVTYSRGLAFRSPHLIVLKYSFVEKAKDAKVDNNDRLDLFVNPVPPLPESKQEAVKLRRRKEDASADMPYIKAVNIRQSGVKGIICGMRVAKSWNDAVAGN